MDWYLGQSLTWLPWPHTLPEGSPFKRSCFPCKPDGALTVTESPLDFLPVFWLYISRSNFACGLCVCDGKCWVMSFF